MDSRIDGVRLEGGVGVEPEISVPMDIRYCNGTDVQVEAAIVNLLKELR